MCYSCCKERLKSSIQGVDVQATSMDIRASRERGMLDSWGSTGGSCKKNCIKYRASASVFCCLGMCSARNQKSSWHAKNTNSLTRCIKWDSLLYVLLIMSTTALLSTENTSFPLQSIPYKAAATTTGINSLT